MTPQVRRQLIQILQSFDEAGLVALANKGLVRRAMKDLEAGGLSFEESDDAVLVHGPDWTVAIPPEGPAHATDDTKATGITRQILTATMFLQQHWIAADSQTAAAEEATDNDQSERVEVDLLHALASEISDDDLNKWAGKTLMRELTRLLPSLEPQIDGTLGVVVRFPQHEVEVRLPPGSIVKRPVQYLDRMLSTAPKIMHKYWVVAAVLAIWQLHDRALPQADSEVLAGDDGGAPRSREELLTNARQLIESMVATGLAHPSQRTLQRLLTLSVSTTAARLPRLGRLLRALAEDVEWILQRDAKADNGRLLGLLCYAYALAGAIESFLPTPPLTLTGRARDVYEPVGELRLAGLGAYPWRTASGYEGVTVLFWNLHSQRFCTWTDSRPIEGGGWFNLDQIYQTRAPWQRGGAVDVLCRRHVTLNQASANAWSRLSASSKTTAALSEPTQPDAIDFGDRRVTSWAKLVDRASRVFPMGLAEPDPLDRVFILQPSKWGERRFDELHQRFVWDLIDEDGLALPLCLPWAGVNENAIEFLESVKPDREKLWGVVARVVFIGAEALIEPLSLLSEGTPRGDRILCPAFDAPRLVTRTTQLLDLLRKKYGRDRIATSLEEDEGDVRLLASGEEPPAPTGMQTLLSRAESMLLSLAESGIQRRNGLVRERFAELSSKARRIGLSELSAAIAKLTDDSASAGSLLTAQYLCTLHRQAMTALSLKPIG